MLVNEPSLSKIEEEILRQYTDRTRNSRNLFESAGQVLPGGITANIKFFSPYPLYMNRASQSRVYDVDGNTYIDYLMCYGALMLGHAHPVIRKSLDKTLERYGTSSFGMPTRLESEYGKMLLELYNRTGMIRFTNSGLEATLLAVRLSKAFTDRKRIGKFEGHYRGSNDRLLISYRPNPKDAGDEQRPEKIPDSSDVDDEAIERTVLLPFNDWEGTERLISENSRDLACIILEPFEEGYIPAEKSFMKSLRDLTSDLRVPLIFDEVKTGFRISLGGASQFYSITPDITCLGKIIGGGFPIGAVIGEKEIMNMLDPRLSSGRRRVFHSGTFNGNPISLSAGRATVEMLEKDKNFESIVNKTNLLKAGFDRSLREADLDHQMLGEGGLFSVAMINDKVKNYRGLQSSNLRLRRIIDLKLILNGVYVKPLERFSISLAHTNEDIGETLEKIDDIVGELSSAYSPS